MTVSSGRPQRFWVYQRGRGHEPVTVAGSIMSFVAVNAMELFLCFWGYGIGVETAIESRSVGRLALRFRKLSLLNFISSTVPEQIRLDKRKKVSRCPGTG